MSPQLPPKPVIIPGLLQGEGVSLPPSSIMTRKIKPIRPPRPNLPPAPRPAPASEASSKIPADSVPSKFLTGRNGAALVPDSEFRFTLENLATAKTNGGPSTNITTSSFKIGRGDEGDDEDERDNSRISEYEDEEEEVEEIEAEGTEEEDLATIASEKELAQRKILQPRINRMKSVPLPTKFTTERMILNKVIKESIMVLSQLSEAPILEASLLKYLGPEVLTPAFKAGISFEDMAKDIRKELQIFEENRVAAAMRLTHSIFFSNLVDSRTEGGTGTRSITNVPKGVHTIPVRSIFTPVSTFTTTANACSIPEESGTDKIKSGTDDSSFKFGKNNFGNGSFSFKSQLAEMEIVCGLDSRTIESNGTPIFGATIDHHIETGGSSAVFTSHMDWEAKNDSKCGNLDVSDRETDLDCPMEDAEDRNIELSIEMEYEIQAPHLSDTRNSELTPAMGNSVTDIGSFTIQEHHLNPASATDSSIWLSTPIPMEVDTCAQSEPAFEESMGCESTFSASELENIAVSVDKHPTFQLIGDLSSPYAVLTDASPLRSFPPTTIDPNQNASEVEIAALNEPETIAQEQYGYIDEPEEDRIERSLDNRIADINSLPEQRNDMFVKQELPEEEVMSDLDRGSKKAQEPFNITGLSEIPQDIEGTIVSEYDLEDLTGISTSEAKTLNQLNATASVNIKERFRDLLSEDPMTHKIQALPVVESIPPDLIAPPPQDTPKDDIKNPEDTPPSVIEDSGNTLQMDYPGTEGEDNEIKDRGHDAVIPLAAKKTFSESNMENNNFRHEKDAILAPVHSRVEEQKMGIIGEVKTKETENRKELEGFFEELDKCSRKWNRGWPLVEKDRRNDKAGRFSMKENEIVEIPAKVDTMESKDTSSPHTNTDYLVLPTPVAVIPISTDPKMRRNHCLKSKLFVPVLRTLATVFAVWFVQIIFQDFFSSVDYRNQAAMVTTMVIGWLVELSVFGIAANSSLRIKVIETEEKLSKENLGEQATDQIVNFIEVVVDWEMSEISGIVEPGVGGLENWRKKPEELAVVDPANVSPALIAMPIVGVCERYEMGLGIGASSNLGIDRRSEWVGSFSLFLLSMVLWGKGRRGQLRRRV